jgi:cytosine/adenosine deaminase-related metal-dependent hydrolase
MGREVALLRSAFPSLGAALAFQMATEHGARAVGLADQVGRIQAGWRADLVLFEASHLAQGDVLESLTRENLPAKYVWVDGERVV